MTESRSTGARWWPALAALLLVSACAPDRTPPRIRPNDNLRPAGRVSGGTLTLALEARMGAWWPDSSWREAPLLMAAFGVRGKAPTIPGPLIRVRTGTMIKVTITNRLDSTLVVHGLQTRPSTSDDTVQVAPGGRRTVSFAAGEPGTYYYWGATSAAKLDERFGDDSQLLGALIVDPAEGPVAPDRVFVISLYGPEVAREDPPAPFAIAFNGRSWPFTERLSVTVGEPVRWRFINASADNHPMHLHGFYYRVDSRGTMLRDTIYTPSDQRQVVTERLSEGTTMTTTWTAERPGQWLMHCHIHFHAAADSNWGPNRPRPPSHAGMAPDLMGDMTGLVLGIIATTSDSSVTAPPPATARRLRLEVEPSPSVPQIRIGLSGDGVAPAPATTPGPPLVLTRGEPAEITVVNRLSEPTAIHWHGIELESYYDGVPGWSGAAPRIAPLIAPGDSFVARMTPPRAGTFIYHAHNLATHQVGDGLVGALLVLEPLEVRRASDEITWIITGNDLFFTDYLEINSARHPAPLVLRANHRYRVRLINITEDNTADVTLGDSSGLARWRPLAKDAMPVAQSRMVPGPAQVRASVGETYDYEFDTGKRGQLMLEVRNAGKLRVSQVVEVR